MKLFVFFIFLVLLSNKKYESIYRQLKKDNNYNDGIFLSILGKMSTKCR